MKQLAEVDYFRSCAARNRERREHRRAGRLRRPRESVVARYADTLYGGSVGAGVNFAKYDDVPVQRRGAGADEVAPLALFDEIQGIPRFLTANIERCKYATPTPVQKHAVPLGLLGHDVMCCSQTGSGKTCAFLLPAVSKLGSAPVDGFDEGQGMAAPRALVLAPTRELAMQTQQEVRKLCFEGPLRSVELYGGTKARPQLHELSLGADIVVATPGRLSDFIERGVITMEHVEYLVLDEADRMLDMGFEPQVRQIVDRSGMKPAANGRQTMLFSATFPPPMQRLAADFMGEYVWLGLGRVGNVAENVTQHVQQCSGAEQKLQLLESALLDAADDQTLIFGALPARPPLPRARALRAGRD